MSTPAGDGARVRLEPHEWQSSPGVLGQHQIIIDVVRVHGSWDTGMVWVYAHLVECSLPSADCTGPWCQELLVGSDRLLNAAALPPRTDRTTPGRPAATERIQMPQLDFKRPTRCCNSGPNCVEVAIDDSGNRVVRNSRQPETQIIFDEAEWAAFLASIRAGQTY